MYLEQVFTQILKMSMTAGWCILAVLVLHLIFHKAPKKYLYALWLVVAFRLLCPFSISTPVGIFQGEQTTVRQTVSEQTSVEQAAVLRSDNSSKVQPMENSQQISIAGGEQQETPARPIIHVAGEKRVLRLASRIWVIGMAALAGYYVFSLWRIRRKLKKAVLAEEQNHHPDWGKIPIYECDSLPSPFAMGMLHPKIYLPYGMKPENREMVLLHEQYHIRRKDQLVKAMACPLLAVYWFHPLVWTAWAVMCRDMEMSCDEKVLELIGKARKKEYSMALLQFASEKPIQSLSMPLGFGEPNVKSRIQHVLKYKKAAVGTGAAAVILIVAGIWLMAGRTGKAQLSEGDEKAVQEQTTEALSDSGAKTTSENETEVASQDEEQVSGEIEQSEETVPAQTSSMPFAVGYDAQETDSTTYLGSDSVQSSYALLVDLDDNTIVSQKSAYDRINPASMTKILTVLVAAEHVTDLDDTFIITKEITDFSYSHDCSAVGFLDEETVTVRDLLYGTILPSGGDAAAGLACYVAGSMDSFVNMMNEKLAELGLSDTAHFTNCVGLYDENHYCSIYDMAMILKAAVENDLAREVLTAHTYTTSATEQHPEGITISNWFLRRIEDKDTKGTVVCAKTGFVAQSGNCAASYEETDSGKHYICVTANAHSSWRCIYDHVAVYQEYTK